MPTPPRLPTSSPSSARLRRLAPSPVKVPEQIDHSIRLKQKPQSHPYSKVNTNSPHPSIHYDPFVVAPSRTASHCRNICNESQSGIGPRGALSPLEDPFEFDFEAAGHTTLTLTTSSSGPSHERIHERNASDEYRDPFQLSRHGSSDSGTSIPVIYDGQGTYARLAKRLRDDLGPDVPGELKIFDHSSPSWEISGLNQSERETEHYGYEGRKGEGEEEEEEQDEDGTPPKRSGISLLTPADYYLECVPCPVLVQFRDVFANQQTSSPEPLSPKSKSIQLSQHQHQCLQQSQQSLSLPSQNLPALLSHSPTMLLPPHPIPLPVPPPSAFSLNEPARAERDSFLTSVEKFGARFPHPPTSNNSNSDKNVDIYRRPSTDTNGEDDDGWSYTLSAYGGEDGRTSIRTSPIPPTAPIMPCLKLDRDEEDSPFSSTSNLELVTPDHDNVELPPRQQSLSSVLSTDTSSPKKYVYQGLTGRVGNESGGGGGGGLRLSFGLGLGSDTCPPPSATLVSASSRPSAIPSATPTVYLTHSQIPAVDQPIPNLKLAHSRAPTLDKALPSLPGPFPSPPFTSTSTSTHSSPTHASFCAMEKTTTVQLWVDQEGTREVCSTLHFVKFHRAEVFRERELRALKEASTRCESPTRPEMFHQSGCVEFGMDPKERDQWVFHHAPFEGFPILRRLTINGDDKYDYLARGASLLIKDPGVYSVSGREERGRVEWQFDYLVTPRISDRTGELLYNEKNVVPLALYVSPNFFEPERASRTHLYNVFKKSLATNISAVKFKTPYIGKPPLSISQPHTPLTMNTSTHNAHEIHAVGANVTSVVHPTRTLLSTIHLSTTSPPQTHEDTDSSLAPTSGITKTFGAIAKAMSNSGSSPVVHKFGTKPPSSNKPSSSRARTPETLVATAGQSGAPGSEEEKKGRRRARTLFSRARPFTPPANIKALDAAPLAPMKSLSSSHATSHPPPESSRQTPSNSITALPSPSFSVTPTPTPTPAPRSRINTTQVQSISSHPFSTQVTPLKSSAVSVGSPLTQKSVNVGDILQMQELMIEEATSCIKRVGTSRRLHEEMKVEFGAGLSPAPRGKSLRKRPSTAEPRLGMNVGAFGHGRM